MKKIMKFLVALLCVAMLLGGCSGNGEQETEAETDGSVENSDAAGSTEPITRGEYTASDYCTLTEYKGLKFAEKDVAASEDEIQEEVDSMLAEAAELKEVTEDRKAAEGDVVNIDYTGYLDDEAFDGGSATGYDLELGSGTFIPGFEDGLIGVKKGEELDLNLTFPDPYKNNPDLAGKEVVFKVKVNSIKEFDTPEYTDELVAEKTDYDTIEAYEKSIADEIRENNITNALAKQLLANAEFASEYPASLRNYYEEFYLQSSESYVQSVLQTTLDEYLESIGTDRETFLEETWGETIENNMQGDLILGVVAEKEGIKAEGQEYEDFLASYAENYNMETEKLLETYGESEFQFLYISDQAYNLIYDSIVIE